MPDVADRLAGEIASVETELAGSGRVLLRPIGHRAGRAGHGRGADRGRSRSGRPSPGGRSRTPDRHRAERHGRPSRPVAPVECHIQFRADPTGRTCGGIRPPSTTKVGPMCGIIAVVRRQPTASPSRPGRSPTVSLRSRRCSIRPGRAHRRRARPGRDHARSRSIVPSEESRACSRCSVTAAARSPARGAGGRPAAVV